MHHVISYLILHFFYWIHVRTVSMVCPWCIHAVFRHHSSWHASSILSCLLDQFLLLNGTHLGWPSFSSFLDSVVMLRQCVLCTLGNTQGKINFWKQRNITSERKDEISKLGEFPIKFSSSRPCPYHICRG